MSRLYKNRQDRPGKKADPKGQATRLFEGTITHETLGILMQFRMQLGRSRTLMQTRVDSLMRLVTPKFAYGDLGIDQLPMSLIEKAPVNSWWVCMELEAVKLMHGYYEAIREGESQAYDTAKARWEHLLADIDHFYPTLIPDRHARGYVLMTAAERAAMKHLADKARMEHEERLGER